jgi:hypothetical protein
MPRSKNAWAVPPLPQYAFMAWFSVYKKAQGQLLKNEVLIQMKLL